MKRLVTIIMYHYIRDLEHSRYPGIKGITVEQFRCQLEYLAKFYTFITVDQLVTAINNEGENLPRNPVLLTFDDGYIDHFMNVFPILYQKGIQGCFFPVGKVIAEKRVLDMNKIHFILASISDHRQLVADIFSLVNKLQSKYILETNQYYYQTYAKSSRFDSPDVMFIKSLLQKGLPAGARAEITDGLFQGYVSNDEEAFVRELYMNLDQLKCMRQAGMFIGSHSYQHCWMDCMSSEAQGIEIAASLQVWNSLNRDSGHRGFVYPYGAHNQSLVSILKEQGYTFALTTRVGIADLENDHPLLLPRLDTNDLPKDGHQRCMVG